MKRPKRLWHDHVMACAYAHVRAGITGYVHTVKWDTDVFMWRVQATATLITARRERLGLLEPCS